jgi:branched-subunit amino acid ABC-type transport system permease component
LISRWGEIDRSREFALFDAALRRRGAAYPQVKIWQGLPKAIWASFALWFCCAASVSLVCSLAVVLFASSLVAQDLHSHPAIGVLIWVLLGSATWLNSVALWQILRRQWPRQQGIPDVISAAVTWMVCIPPLPISGAIFSIFAMASVVSLVQWAVRSPAAPSTWLGAAFATTAIAAGLISRALWKRLRRARISWTAAPPEASGVVEAAP